MNNLPVNHFRNALKAGRTQIGCWCSLANPIAVEIAAGAGFDWLLLDTEHAPNELPMVLNQLHACAESVVTPIVRPAWNDPVLIKRFLDIGVQTLLLPYIQNAAEAEKAVAATRYPPTGIRGVAGMARSSRYGRVRDYLKRAQEELCVLVQVENQQGLENVTAIAGTEGVDGVFIGPSDLAASLGHLGEPQHPTVQAAISDLIAHIRASGKAAGILATQENEAQRYLDLGCLFVAVTHDVPLLARTLESIVAQFKK